jgi:ceramide glucosyltransferase
MKVFFPHTVNAIGLAADFMSVLVLTLISLQVRAESRLFSIKGDFESTASVIVPVRGIDPELEENLRSLLSQDYPYGYEAIFVVDQDDVETANFLKGKGFNTVLADFECSTCSGKVKAQLSGLKHAKGEVVVFADSDTRFRRDWLREMVRPLSHYTASTTFSWPSPLKLSLQNLIRAGFWTLGFESQAIGGTFLWGGSMAFRREFLTEDVVRELANNWCDDCTLTRLVKQRGGSIAFNLRAMPLNVYDERSLCRWMTRQVITIWRHSPRGAKAFIVVITSILGILILGVISHSLFPLLIPLAWIAKNFLRSREMGALSILPSLLSIVGAIAGYVTLISSRNKRVIQWRDKVYLT